MPKQIKTTVAYRLATNKEIKEATKPKSQKMWAVQAITGHIMVSYSNRDMAYARSREMFGITKVVPVMVSTLK